MRVGILGCGRIGHVRALSIQQIAEAKLVAVADVAASAAEALALHYGVEARTVEGIATAGDIDAVVIAT